MPIKRTIIIPAILALSTAGSVLAGSAAVLATQAPAAVAATAAAKQPAFVYHG
jgi:hypothetical protein